MLNITEVPDSLMWSAFWHTNSHSFLPIVQSAIKLKDILLAKKFEQVSAAAVALCNNLMHLLKSARWNQLGHYSMNFQKIIAIIKQLFAVDSNSNWLFHLKTVQASKRIQQKFVAVNNLYYTSWNLKRIHFLGLPTQHSIAGFIEYILLWRTRQLQYFLLW